jgi:hypothetical protein
VLSRGEGQGFCGLYLEKVGKKRAASLQPWLARIDQCFRRETIQSIPSEWMT